MKTIYLIFIALTLALKPVFSEEKMRAEDFSLTIKPVGVASLRRGVMLDVDVKYLGEKNIDVYPLNGLTLHITFEAPPEWQAKNIKPRVVHVGVPHSCVTLKKSNSLSTTMFLNYYLSVIMPGEVVLNAKLHLVSRTGTQSDVLETQVSLNVINENDISLRKYVTALAMQIKKETDYKKRINMYHQLLFISSDNVIDILLYGIKDKHVGSLYSHMGRKILNLAAKYRQEEKIVDYLLNNGNVGDEWFFGDREGKRTKFSDKEWEQLQSAKNMWIQLYSVKYRPINFNYEENDKLEDIDRLERRIDEMRLMCKEIKEKELSRQKKKNEKGKRGHPL